MYVKCTSNHLHISDFAIFKDTHRENCVFLNSVQEFVEVETWLSLAFFYVYAIN